MLEQVVYPYCTENVFEYCDNLASRKTQKYVKISSIAYFGKEKMLTNNVIQMFNLSRSAKGFSRIVLGKTLFTSSTKINERFCNHFAQLVNGKFIKIIQFIVDFETERELTLCQVFKTRPNSYASTIREIVGLPDELICIETKEIERACIFIETPKKNYIIPVPNTLFY